MKILKVYYKDGSDREFKNFLSIEFNWGVYTVYCENFKRYCFTETVLKNYKETQAES